MPLVERIPRASPADHAFREYVQLLLQLHHMFVTGTDQTEAADAIRELMDEPWRRLDSQGKLRIRCLSGDLFSIGQTPRSDARRASDCAHQISAAIDCGDCDEALQLTRKHEQELSSFQVAQFRGRCWTELNQPDVAALFFEEAERLHTQQRNLPACPVA